MGAIVLGMGVYRFEDLRVWQAAKKQCDHVGELLKRPEFRRDQQMSEQMNDAAEMAEHAGQPTPRGKDGLRIRDGPRTKNGPGT